MAAGRRAQMAGGGSTDVEAELRRGFKAPVVTRPDPAAAVYEVRFSRQRATSSAPKSTSAASPIRRAAGGGFLGSCLIFTYRKKPARSRELLSLKLLPLWPSTQPIQRTRRELIRVNKMGFFTEAGHVQIFLSNHVSDSLSVGGADKTTTRL